MQRVRDAGAIAMIHIAADTSTPYAQGNRICGTGMEHRRVCSRCDSVLFAIRFLEIGHMRKPCPYAGLVSIRLQQGRSKWNASIEMYAGAFRRLYYSTGRPSRR